MKFGAKIDYSGDKIKYVWYLTSHAGKLKWKIVEKYFMMVLWDQTKYKYKNKWCYEGIIIIITIPARHKPRWFKPLLVGTSEFFETYARLLYLSFRMNENICKKSKDWMMLRTRETD